MTHPPTAARRGRHAPLAPPACCGWVPGSLRRRDAMAGSPPISTQGGTLSAVLFDMDGTLVAGDDHHFEAYADTLLEMEPQFNGGKRITREFYNTRMSGRQNPVLLKEIMPDVSPERGVVIADTKERAYMRRTAGAIEALAGAAALLDVLAAAGVRLGVVTNAPREIMEHTLGEAALRDRFPVVIVGDECARAKPFPDPYVDGCRALDVQPREAIAFEDSPSGITSAVAAGLLTIGVGTGHPPATLLAAGAAFVIHDYYDERLATVLGLWLGEGARSAVLGAGAQ
ncbi:hypothetical protein BU14_0403s0019 [Porphyra umbilicalis]|uniref:HAD family phosphatase n=1 Tax=Porphyra umbilicalis TaxID=2786 RepID=A0A1X6NWD3_PORUM|nr:hypothetical protein BU14_0403s0019 [Porphyra umbilicalis]|eukprot:OSX72816.1 hypothetical protein BU14_0403s0019 [Porphyra umbilicalis]